MMKKKEEDGLEIYIVPQDRVHWVKNNSYCSPSVFEILLCRIIAAWCKIDTSFDSKSMNLSERAVLQSSDSLVSWKDFSS